MFNLQTHPKENTYSFAFSLYYIYKLQQTVIITVHFEKGKAAIQAVISQETESYYEQDFNAWKSTYLQSPAFRKFGYWEGYAEKVASNIGFESLVEEKKKQFDANETL